MPAIIEKITPGSHIQFVYIGEDGPTNRRGFVHEIRQTSKGKRFVVKHGPATFKQYNPDLMYAARYA